MRECQDADDEGAVTGGRERIQDAAALVTE